MKKLILITAIAGLGLSANAQNVGIGTTNPQNKLHVAGDVRIETTDAGAAADAVLVIDTDGVVKAMPAGSAANTAADAKLGVNDEPWFNRATNTGATGNTQSIYTMGGLIGMGTDTPLYNLHVQRSGTSQLALDDTTGKLNIMTFIAGTKAKFIKYGPNYVGGNVHDNGADQFAIVNEGNISVGSSTGGIITLGGSSSDKTDVTMTIDNSTNNVGIGTITAQAKLDVHGYVKVGGADTIADGALTQGLIRFNSGTGHFEGYNGTAWLQLDN